MDVFLYLPFNLLPKVSVLKEINISSGVTIRETGGWYYHPFKEGKGPESEVFYGMHKHVYDEIISQHKKLTSIPSVFIAGRVLNDH